MLHLLPESIELAQSSGGRVAWTAVAALLGFASLHAIDRWTHGDDARGGSSHSHRHSTAGLVPAAAMIGHSLIDGAVIGLAFQASTPLGASMALAVAAHDLCDGLGIVGLLLAQRRDSRTALNVLALNAMAPAIGAAAATLFAAPLPALSLAMGYMAGCLVHVIANDLLPRVLAGGIAAMRWTTPALVACGFALATVAVHGSA